MKFILLKIRFHSFKFWFIFMYCTALIGQVTSVNKLFYRYSQFYMEDSFCHYNMFNHHFFDGKVRIMTIICSLIVEEQIQEYLLCYFSKVPQDQIVAVPPFIDIYFCSFTESILSIQKRSSYSSFMTFHCFWIKTYFLTKPRVAPWDLTPATLQPLLSLFLLCCLCSGTGHMTCISNWLFHNTCFYPRSPLSRLLSLCLVKFTSSFREFCSKSLPPVSPEPQTRSGSLLQIYDAVIK